MPNTNGYQSAHKLLLHCCCGPCATACIQRLLEADIRPTLYFSNSNMDSEVEFLRRLEELRRVAGHFELGQVIVDDYRHDQWHDHCRQALPEYAIFTERGPRCVHCFQWSLNRTALAAAALEMPFATSLTVSPHKNSKLLLKLGSEYQNFSPWDFKKKDGFKRSLELSKELQLYRQNYCGCEFSLEEARQRLANNPAQ